MQSITWTNLTSGNVSVALFSGSNPVVTVAQLTTSAINTGTYLWMPETWLPSGNDYTIGVTDLSGTAPVQYSPFFTVQLCSTCSSSTRSTTSSFSVATVSVSGLDIGTRTDAAYPTQASSAATASGSQVQSGVAASASSTMKVSTGAGVVASASSRASALASAVSVQGASQNAILSQTGSAAVASATSTAVKAATSGAESVQAAGFFSLLLFVAALF